MKYLRSEGSPIATDELFALSKGPARMVHCYPSCIVNGVRFRSKERDERKKTQNSGVSVLGEHDDDEIDFYGYLTNVVALDYIMDYKVVVFKCDWYNTDPKKKRIKRDYHFKSVYTKDKWFVNDPYILAIQAKQVFYVDDPKFGRDWKVVQIVEQRQVWDVIEKEDNSDAYQQLQTGMVEFARDPDIDPEHYKNDDQGTGGMELTNLTEQQLQQMRQNLEKTNDYEHPFIDDDVDDECLDENDTYSDS